MKLHEPPLWDDVWAADELACHGGYRWLLLSHGFNLRLVAVPVGPQGRTGYEWGWCFVRDVDAARRAVAAWDPDTQDEPTGWHKRPVHPVRRAPHRDRDPGYNRPRCDHGVYDDQECSSIGCPHWVRRLADHPTGGRA